MKPILILSILCISLVSFYSCKKDRNQSENTLNDKVMVSFKMAGELSFETEPLKTAGVSTENEQILYGVIITTQINNKDSLQAYGLFDDPTKVVAELKAQTTYKIHVTAIRNGSGYGIHSSSNSFSEPFNLPLTNSFFYSYNYNYPYPKFTQLARVYTSAAKTETVKKEYAELDRYMGILENFVPGSVVSASIPLQRLTAGIKIKAPEITKGKLIISGGITDTIDVDKKETKIHLYELYPKAYIQGQIDNSYGSQVSLSIKWIKPDNSEILLYPSRVVDLSRNILTIATVKMPTTSSVSISLDDNSMTTKEIVLSN